MDRYLCWINRPTRRVWQCPLVLKSGDPSVLPCKCCEHDNIQTCNLATPKYDATVSTRVRA